MNPPVPPLVLRRIILDPIYFVLAPVGMLLLILLGLVSALLEIFSSRKRGWRLLWTAAAAVFLDWSIFTRCLWLWCAMPPWRRDPQEWTVRHFAVLSQELRRFMLYADRLVGLRFEVSAPSPAPGRPVLLLARHAGVGDSLLMVFLITDALQRVPRVVLKKALLWDPAMDLCIRRLGAYFIAAHGVSRGKQQQQLQSFAASLGPQDATLLFPEGRNWTPRRHRAELEEALSDGEPERAAWLERHPRVLSPHATGVRRILATRPDCQVLIGGHQGLEDLRSVPIIWRALPLHRDIHVELRAVEPPSDEHIADWLHDEWSRLDRWTDALDDD